MAEGPIRALTGRRRTRLTSTGCRNPWQPEPGRAPLIPAQAAVQTNGTTSSGRLGPNAAHGRRPPILLDAVGNLGPKAKFSFLGRFFGASHEFVDPLKGQRVDPLDEARAVGLLRLFHLILPRLTGLAKHLCQLTAHRAPSRHLPLYVRFSVGHSDDGLRPLGTQAVPLTRSTKSVRDAHWRVVRVAPRRLTQRA